MSAETDDWRVEIYPPYACAQCEWTGSSDELENTPYPVCPACGSGVHVDR